MKIAHSDGGDFVLTADLREASYIAYLILESNGDGSLTRNDWGEELMRGALDVIKAQQIPGSKDSVLAYGEQQAAEMLQSANAATPPESPTSEGSANV
jgi:hypothetical protein